MDKLKRVGPTSSDGAQRYARASYEQTSKLDKETMHNVGGRSATAALLRKSIQSSAVSSVTKGGGGLETHMCARRAGHAPLLKARLSTPGGAQAGDTSHTHTIKNLRHCPLSSACLLTNLHQMRAQPPLALSERVALLAFGEHCATQLLAWSAHMGSAEREGRDGFMLLCL